MLIILEGIDGSGKSTLAQQIREHIENRGGSADVIHRGVPVEHMLDEYETGLFDYVPGGHSIIADRWHIGPDVYGPIKRNDDGLDPVIRFHINQYLTAKGALLVHTGAPRGILIERLSSRGEDYITLDDVDLVTEFYERAYEASPLPKVQSLTGKHNAALVVYDAEIEAAAARQSGEIKTYAGPRRPSRLIVGDTSTPIAFMPFEDTREYAIVEKYMSKRTGFVDAKDPFGLARIWDALYNPYSVIAVDEKSAELLTENNVPFVYEEA